MQLKWEKEREEASFIDFQVNWIDSCDFIAIAKKKTSDDLPRTTKLSKSIWM